MSFQSLGLSKPLLEAITKNNISKPYPIQSKAIPAVLDKKDIMGIAKTGSGKTASYVLPILEQLINKSKTANNRVVDILVLVPTRELAEQVKNVFYDYSQHLHETIKTKAVYGGVSINPQMKNLNGINVLVATPGRLIELVNAKAITLNQIETLVLDEADKMLNLGFKEEIDKIFTLLPKKRQNLLFSATLTDDISQINQLILDNPLVVKIEDKKQDVDNIVQTGYAVSDENKGPLLRYLIKKYEMKQVLVFVSSGKKADNVAHKLRKNGFEAESIHGKKSQNTRLKNLYEFKEGYLPILVATDLLARGVDIEGLPFVINYELPRSPKDYVHRIGRTGRADKSGEAISLITDNDKHHFRVIQKKMKKWVTMVDASNIDLTSY